MKKLFFIIPILISLVYLKPVKAEGYESPQPYDYSDGLLDRDELILENNLIPEWYDNDNTAYVNGQADTTYSVLFHYPVNLSAYYIKSNITYPAQIRITYYDELNNTLRTTDVPNKQQDGYFSVSVNNVIKIDIIIGNMGARQIYEIEFFGSYSTGDEIEIPDESIGNVSNLKETHTHDSVTLTWDNPSNLNFAGVKIYRNDVVIADVGITNKFIDTNVESDTTYIYKVVAYDLEGNESSGNIITVKTSEKPNTIKPNPPTNVKVVNGNGYVYVSWTGESKNTYNVYVNGKKVNSNPIIAKSYQIMNLDNDKEYEIYVTSVNNAGLESEISQIVIGLPSADLLPSINTGYDLIDVANGIGHWFSNLWLLIAFAVAIPLSFYIGSRIKLLFVGS